MTVDATEVVVGADGRVSVAPVGTAVPTSATASLDAAFIEVGYISEDGVTFKSGADIEDINAWQSFYPIRKLITARSAGVEFVMRQWNGDNILLAFGGGQVVESGGTTTYAPPTPSEFDERVMVVEWEDGDNNYRLVIPRGLASGEVETHLVRNAAADLPIAFDVTPSGDADTLSSTPTAPELATQPWYLITDSSEFAT